MAHLQLERIHEVLLKEEGGRARTATTTGTGTARPASACGAACLRTVRLLWLVLSYYCAITTEFNLHFRELSFFLPRLGCHHWGARPPLRRG